MLADVEEMGLEVVEKFVLVEVVFSEGVEERQGADVGHGSGAGQRGRGHEERAGVGQGVGVGQGEGVGH